MVNRLFFYEWVDLAYFIRKLQPIIDKFAQCWLVNN